MKNLTLVIAFIIGTSFALSAQRGGTLNSNTNTSSNSNIRGNSNLNTNPNLGTTNRDASSRYGRPGNGRPNGHGHTNNGRPGNNGHGHHNNGRPNGYGNGGHHNNGHHNNGHHGHYNNGRPNGYGNGGHHNNGHHGHHNNGHHGHNVNVVVTAGHHGHNYNGFCNYTNHTYGWRPVCVNDFNVGCRSIRNCGYDRDRLRSARHFVRNNYVSAYQIADIMMMFSFESTRLEFAKYAFHRTCDVQNYGVVFNQLSFNSSRRELDCYIRDFHW